MARPLSKRAHCFASLQFHLRSQDRLSEVRRNQCGKAIPFARQKVYRPSIADALPLCNGRIAIKNAHSPYAVVRLEPHLEVGGAVSGETHIRIHIPIQYHTAVDL